MLKFVIWKIKSNCIKLFYFIWYYGYYLFQNKDFKKTVKIHKDFWNKLTTFPLLRDVVRRKNVQDKSNHSCSMIEYILDNNGYMNDIVYKKLKTFLPVVKKIYIYSKGFEYPTVCFANNGFTNLIYKNRIISCNDIDQCITTLGKILSRNIKYIKG